MQYNPTERYKYSAQHYMVYLRFSAIFLIFITFTACASSKPSSGYYSILQESATKQTYEQNNSSVMRVNPKKQHSSPKQLPKKLPGHYKPYVVFGKAYYPIFDAEGFTQTGLASWYGPTFHGKKTSNGEIYNMYEETAAHKTLPMGTIVRVTNLENNRVAVLRINDRGPFVGDRIIDLSKTAAEKLDIVQKGTGKVRVEVIKAPPPIQAKHNGTYYVQVGAFSDEITANSIQASIGRMGMKTRLVKVDNKNLWKVQVGPLQQIADSTKTKTELAYDFPDSYIVLE